MSNCALKDRVLQIDSFGHAHVILADNSFVTMADDDYLSFAVNLSVAVYVVFKVPNKIGDKKTEVHGMYMAESMHSFVEFLCCFLHAMYMLILLSLFSTPHGHFMDHPVDFPHSSRIKIRIEDLA